MLDRIKSLFVDREGAPESGSRHSHSDLMVAAACLLVEAATTDAEFDDDERRTIGRLLARRFDLEDADAVSLVETAEARVSETHELYSFARTVKDAFDHEERVELMEMLWEVVYADGELHDYEANLMRRIAGLIYVSDRESGAARKRALQSLGLDQS